MPKYFFDIRSAGREHRDNDGIEFDSLDEARREAIRALCEMAQEAAPERDVGYRQAIVVRDADGSDLLRIGLTFDTQIAETA